MKYIYKTLFLLIVFLGSLFFFAYHMTENVFRIDKKVTDMSEASLPVISMRIGENEINRLHGYCSNLDEMLIRESLTPVSSDQAFTVLISEGSYDIKKVNYDITDAQTGQLIESGSVIALNKEGDSKTANIKLKEVLSPNAEYVTKITLISNESKRIYYYTRLIMIDDSFLMEKISFVNEFHQDILAGDPEGKTKKYLEYKVNTENTSFARVNIYSSANMVNWGALAPAVIFEDIPTITEFTKDTASVVLSFYVSVDTDSGTEYYQVKEFYRFRYTQLRVYLFNFEREMEAVFQPELVSLKKSEFKIGITGQPETEFYTNSGNNIVAFVRNRELFTYNISDNNNVVKVFSYLQDNSDYIRDNFDQHDVRIMNIDDDGNIDFMVYGYMNRGEYEGRVGVVVYRYNRLSGFIEEQMYLPINTTYQILKDEIGDLAYRNKYDVIYFTVFNNIYSYNFVSEVLTILATDIDPEYIVFSHKEQYAVWQNGKEYADSITVLMLETGEKKIISSKEGEYIKVLGSIDENFIYGFVKKEDIALTSIGETIYPMYMIIISSKDSEIRNYQRDNYFIISVNTSANIELNCVMRSEASYSGYVPTDNDYLLNHIISKDSSFEITTRVTALTMTEYYISLPSGFAMKEVPTVSTVQNAVITNDPTVRISKPETYKNHYYAYSFGRLILNTVKAGEAVVAADVFVGTVIDSSGKIVWQRGMKTGKAEITGIVPVYDNNLDSIQAALKMLFLYKSVDIDTSSITRENKSIIDWIEGYLKVQTLDLSGASLEEVLYMVSKGRPVFGMKEDNKAVLITAYDSGSVTMIDPTERRTLTMAMKEAENMFEKAGNLFISYMD